MEWGEGESLPDQHALQFIPEVFHSKVKLNLREDACFTWRLSVVLRTPKRNKKKKKQNPVVFTMGLLFTQKCLLLDNLDKNVTASLHVLQIHGVKPLKQLMESSHIISC